LHKVTIVPQISAGRVRLISIQRPFFFMEADSRVVGMESRFFYLPYYFIVFFPDVIVQFKNGL
jgi:hypothetical protein